MANKLTDDKLTELIKQTLNEFKVGDFNIDYDDWKICRLKNNGQRS